MGTTSDDSDAVFDGLAQLGNPTSDSAGRGGKSFVDLFNAKCVLRNKDQVRHLGVSNTGERQSMSSIADRKALPDLRKWSDVAVLRTAFDFANHGVAPQVKSLSLAGVPGSEVASTKAAQRAKRSTQQGAHSSVRGAANSYSDASLFPQYPTCAHEQAWSATYEIRHQQSFSAAGSKLTVSEALRSTLEHQVSKQVRLTQ